MKKNINKIVSVIVLLISAFFAKDYVTTEQHQPKTSSNNRSVNQDSKVNSLDVVIRKKQSGIMLTIKAKIINVLADDNKGDRHQRMILRVGKHTVLLAHNIDIAPRVPARKGDTIRVHGQYEWNDKGGVIHWTHSSSNSHAGGWIEFNNKKYQ